MSRVCLCENLQQADTFIMLLQRCFCTTLTSLPCSVFVINDIEAPKALDVQLRLPERGKFCFDGHFKRWQKEFSPVLSPYKLVKSKCQFCEVPNGFLACKVVSRH